MLKDKGQYLTENGEPNHTFWILWKEKKDALKLEGWRVYMEKKTGLFRVTNVKWKCGLKYPTNEPKDEPKAIEPKNKRAPLPGKGHMACHKHAPFYGVFKYTLSPVGIVKVLVKAKIPKYELALCWVDDLAEMSETPELDGYYFVKPWKKQKEGQQIAILGDAKDPELCELAGIDYGMAKNPLLLHYF